MHLCLSWLGQILIVYSHNYLLGKMKKKNAALNLAVLFSFSFLIVIGLYFFNTWFPIRWKAVLGYEISLPIHYAYFGEGIMFLLFCFLLLLGSSGINVWTVKAILNSSVADWLYGRESNKKRVRPSEIFHADVWRPKGFPRASLTCISAGIIMLLIYFLHFVAFGR